MNWLSGVAVSNGAVYPDEVDEWVPPGVEKFMEPEEEDPEPAPLPVDVLVVAPSGVNTDC